MKRSSFVLVFCFLAILAIIACGGSPTPVHEEPVYEEPMEEPAEEEPMEAEPAEEEPMEEEPAEPAQPEPPAEESKSAEFNPSDANKVSPNDVLDEVTYYSGGGRGSTCEWATEPTLNILSGFGAHEWMDWILVDSCGWQENEIVTATVIYPDSTQASERVDAGTYGMFTYDIEPTRSMQPGAYTITIEGNSGYVEDSAEVIVPSSPRMYRVKGNWLVLYSFSPHENIRLFAYESVDFFTMRLIGWKQYQTDSTGQLMIQTPNQGYFYYADGEISGLVRNSEMGSPTLGSDILVSNCGGLPSRLSAEAGARVTFTDGSDMRIREKPGFSENILTTVPEGTAIVILNSRKCVEGSTWWKILTDEGLEGWMAEDQNGVYLLEPYP
jgi:hypothetical protein